MNTETMRKSDRLIPWYFVLFFLVIAAVDGTFVTIAIRTQTGVVAEHAYEQGLAYNATLDEAVRQQALGWQGKLDLVDGNVIVFHLTDRTSAPLQGADVKAHITRPVQDGYDFDLPLKEKNGSYQAAVQFPLPGSWDINVEAVWRNQHYYMKKNVEAMPVR